MKIIASVDEDPIFESITITLLSIFKDMEYQYGSDKNRYFLSSQI
ncbi:hypothetical protein GMMP15_940021 [Candidatus Magnetomoraceae bacterium gMMP-15]